MEVQSVMKSKVGPIYLTASDKGLTGVFWRKRPVSMGSSRFLAQAERELREYFEGRRRKFSVPLDFDGTEFQRKVWRELAKIPYGKTISYSDLAARIGHDRAVRAVGTANGRNPLSIVVPCHRVIAANGALGGYTAGLKVKSELLAIEGWS